MNPWWYAIIEKYSRQILGGVMRRIRVPFLDDIRTGANASHDGSL
jgi:hypothetical protein